MSLKEIETSSLKYNIHDNMKALLIRNLNDENESKIKIHHF